MEQSPQSITRRTHFSLVCSLSSRSKSLAKSWPVFKDTDQKAFHGEGKLANSRNSKEFLIYSFKNVRKTTPEALPA